MTQAPCGQTYRSYLTLSSRHKCLRISKSRRAQSARLKLPMFLNRFNRSFSLHTVDAWNAAVSWCSLNAEVVSLVSAGSSVPFSSAASPFSQGSDKQAYKLRFKISSIGYNMFTGAHLTHWTKSFLIDFNINFFTKLLQSFFIWLHFIKVLVLISLIQWQPAMTLNALWKRANITVSKNLRQITAVYP